MSKDVKKLLAVNFGGIGDEILFFPTLKTLKSTYENSSLTLVVEPRSKSAQQLTNLVDDIITCDIKGKNKYLEILKFLFKAWTGKYDLVVSSGGSKVVSVLLFLTGIKERYGYDSGKLSQKLLTKAMPLNQQQYAANMYHDLVKEIAPDAVYGLPEVSISQENLSWASEAVGSRDKKIILIHPGVSQMSISKKIYKFWSVNNWAELVRKLVQSDKYKIVLTGGPDDSAIIQEIRSALVKFSYLDENIIDMFGKTKNIAQLAALMRVSNAVICVDSAPMHIAVGVRTNVLAIFGPTDEKKLLPVNDYRFIAITNENLECRPCLWDKRQVSCDNTECLDINVEKIFNAVENFAPFSA